MSVKTRHPSGMLDTPRRQAIRYQRRRQGLKSVVDAKPVQEHILKLHSYGLGFSSIAQVAGCNDRTLRFIADGRNETVYMYVANGIMNVTPIPDPRQSWVLRIGAKRRLQALHRMGYAHTDLDKHLGAGMANCFENGKGPTISYESWSRIKELYDELSAVRGPSKRASSYAKRKGWPSPWDWETVNIDDPLAYPVRVEGPSRGDLKRQAAALDKPGVSANDLAERLGVSQRTIVRWRTERGYGAEEIGGERKTM